MRRLLFVDDDWMRWSGLLRKAGKVDRELTDRWGPQDSEAGLDWSEVLPK